MKTPTLTPDLLRRVDAYRRAAGYLAVGQIFLCDNPLLQRPLVLGDIKHMLLGHWGTTPRQNFIYVHPAPQWLTMETAVKHCAQGVGIWSWASNDQDVASPDLVMACCGDVPTLETLAAVSILREHLPALKIRVINVVDLMRLQPQGEHPHGLGDTDFDALFTREKPVILAVHAYPWLIRRLTYRRTNHDNIHVRGYKEEGTVTTPST